MQIEDLQALCAYPPTNIKLKESYAHHTIKIFIFIWNKFKEWLINNNKESINENNINEYIKYISIIYTNEELSPTHFMKKVEALNALKRYCAFGVFRLSEKFDSISFYGEDEKYFKMFLEEYSKNHCRISINRIKKYIFILFNKLISKNITLNNIDTNIIDDIFNEGLAHRQNNYNLKKSIKTFLEWCYNKKIICVNISKYIIIHRKTKYKFLHTSFSRHECKLILQSIDRNSSIGKRDYAMFLCLMVYGWRVGDICNLNLQDIDWKKRIIYFEQQKTKAKVEFPIIKSTGNALADYLKNSRPKTETNKVFVNLSKINNGKEIHITTVYEILLKYLRRAKIQNIFERKHGSHSLRFSLATSLIENGESLELTKDILGHTSIETTFRYIRLDINTLKKCPLEMPECLSPYYK